MWQRWSHQAVRISHWGNQGAAQSMMRTFPFTSVSTWCIIVFWVLFCICHKNIAWIWNKMNWEVFTHIRHTSILLVFSWCSYIHVNCRHGDVPACHGSWSWRCLEMQWVDIWGKYVSIRERNEGAADSRGISWNSFECHLFCCCLCLLNFWLLLLFAYETL